MVSRLLSGVVFSTTVLAGCAFLESAVEPQQCWQDRAEFAFDPTTVEGIVQVDLEASAMFIRMPDGREFDLGFPDGYRVTVGPGQEGRVDDPRGRTIAEAGDQISLWGGDTHVGEEPVPPASTGRRGLIICVINGQQVRDANGRTIGH